MIHMIEEAKDVPWIWIRNMCLGIEIEVLVNSDLWKLNRVRATWNNIFAGDPSIFQAMQTKAYDFLSWREKWHAIVDFSNSTFPPLFNYFNLKVFCLFKIHLFNLLASWHMSFTMVLAHITLNLTHLISYHGYNLSNFAKIEKKNRMRKS
jgi:hypothetical protein